MTAVRKLFTDNRQLTTDNCFSELPGGSGPQGGQKELQFG